jgi:hypothetical protein
MPTVRIPDEQFERMKRYAVPLVDSVGDVLARILDSYDPSTRPVREINQDNCDELWNIIARKFNSFENARFFANPFPGKSTWAQVKTGRSDVHYEWLVHKEDAKLDVALHFEAADAKVNAARLASLSKILDAVTKGITEEQRSRLWNKNKQYGEFAFRIPYKGGVVSEAALNRAASLMQTFIDRSWDFVKNI